MANTDRGKPGDAFWMRAEMNSHCMPYTTPDFVNVTLAIHRDIEDDPNCKPSDQLPTSKDWLDVLVPDCKNINSSTLVPLFKEAVPTVVTQQGMFNARSEVKNTSTGPEGAFFVN